MHLTYYKTFSILSPELIKFLEQKLRIKRVKQYNLVERIFSNTQSGGRTVDDQKDIFISASVNSQVEGEYRFLFNIFEEELDFEFGAEYKQGLETNFLQSIKNLQVITNIQFLNLIQDRFYAKFVTPRYKTRTTGIDSYSVTIPVIGENIQPLLQSVASLLKIEVKKIFGNLLKVSTNDYLVEFTFFNNKIKILMLLIEEFTFSVEPVVGLNGKLQKGNITINCKAMYTDIPYVPEGSDSMSFLNGSEYLFRP